MPTPRNPERARQIELETTEIVDRIIQQIDTLLDELGRGSRKEVMEVLGVSSSFLADHKRNRRKAGSDINMRKLLRILLALDQDVLVFFTRALHRLDGAEEPEDIEAAGMPEPEVVRLAKLALGRE